MNLQDVTIDMIVELHKRLKWANKEDDDIAAAVADLFDTEARKESSDNPLLKKILLEEYMRLKSDPAMQILALLDPKEYISQVMLSEYFKGLLVGYYIATDRPIPDKWEARAQKAQEDENGGVVS